VVAGGVFGDDLALEAGEGVGEQWCAAGPGLPVEAGESVRAGRGRACRDRLVLSSQHVDADASRPRIRDQVSEVRDAQNETSGGSSETEASEFTISPAGAPSGAAVTKATPVVNLPSASRNERASGAGGAGIGAASAISVERRLFAEGDAAEVVVGGLAPSGCMNEPALT
jgi:hypothetical protein